MNYSRALLMDMNVLLVIFTRTFVCLYVSIATLLVAVNEVRQSCKLQNMSFFQYGWQHFFCLWLSHSCVFVSVCLSASEKQLIKN